MKATLFTALFISVAATAHADVDQIALVLSGYDNAVSVSDLARLSDDPVADLIAVANDSASRFFARGRAVQLLGNYNEPRAHDALLAFSSHQLPLLRVRSLKAMSALASRDSAFAARTDIQGALSSGLNDADITVRLQAVRAMASIPAMHLTLAQHMQVEKEARVLDLTGELLAK